MEGVHTFFPIAYLLNFFFSVKLFSENLLKYSWILKKKRFLNVVYKHKQVMVLFCCEVCCICGPGLLSTTNGPLLGARGLGPPRIRPSLYSREEWGRGKCTSWIECMFHLSYSVCMHSSFSRCVSLTRAHTLHKGMHICNIWDMLRAQYMVKFDLSCIVDMGDLAEPFV